MRGPSNEARCIRPTREHDGQAAGGDDGGGDDWIFSTIREKDPKRLQNGAAQQEELERSEVGRQARHFARIPPASYLLPPAGGGDSSLHVHSYSLLAGR